jgi:hypothetical protein
VPRLYQLGYPGEFGAQPRIRTENDAAFEAADFTTLSSRAIGAHGRIRTCRTLASRTSAFTIWPRAQFGDLDGNRTRVLSVTSWRPSIGRRDLLVPSAGLEPARTSRMLLRHVCLPFHHEGILGLGGTRGGANAPRRA